MMHACIYCVIASLIVDMVKKQIWVLDLRYDLSFIISREQTYQTQYGLGNLQQYMEGHEMPGVSGKCTTAGGRVYSRTR